MEKVGGHGPEMKPIRNSDEYRGAVEELSLQRTVFNFYPEYQTLQDKDPKEVIDNLVQDLSEKPKILTREDAQQFQKELYLGPGQRTSIDCGEPNALEGYLLCKIVTTDPEVLKFDSTPEAEAHKFSVAESVHMLRDTVRTKRFMEGVLEAVRQLELQNKETLYVCDAGSGALPILGIRAALTSNAVRAVCIETDPQSVKMAEVLVKSFGLEDRVTVVQADARSYIPEHPIDILISETMDAGLMNEPMCEIIEHLNKYVSETGVVIPQSVFVYAGIVLESKYVEAQRFTLIDEDLSPLLKIDWQKVGDYRPGNGVPTITGELRNTYGSEPTLIMVTSKVVVHDKIAEIGFNESRLSSPIPVSGASEQFMVPRVIKDTVQLEYTAGTPPSRVTLRQLDLEK